jgi:hypothetical protein
MSLNMMLPYYKLLYIIKILPIKWAQFLRLTHGFTYWFYRILIDMQEDAQHENF